MDSIKNILIGGEKGIGKTYLVHKLIEQLQGKKNIKGYFTLMHKDKIDQELNGHEIYIYPAELSIENRKEDQSNLIGCSDGKTRKINTNVFKTLGVELLSNYDDSSVVIMDEIGFFESDIVKFTSKVFEALESNSKCIVVVKEKYDNEYINKVREYKEKENTIFVQLTKENRDEVFTLLEKIVKAW